MIIYKAVNKINKKTYVGRTVGSLSKRISKHICRPRYPFGKALKKYGLQSFDISIIDNAETADILKEKEMYWISFYGCKVPNGYNLTDGGEGTYGYHPSQVTLLKQRESHLGKRLSRETCQKMRERMLWDGHPMRGKHHTEETREKMRRAKLGKTPPAACLKNLNHKGQPMSEEQKNNIRVAKLKYKFTPEHIENLRRSRFGNHNRLGGRKYTR